MSKIATVFMQELRILLKDRQALGLLVVMPLALIVFLTMAMQDIYHAKIGRSVGLVVVSSGTCDPLSDGAVVTEETTMCSQLVTELKRFHSDVRVVKSLDAEKKLELALILPDDIDSTIAKLKEGEKLQPAEQIQLIFDPVLDQSLRAVVQGHLLLSLQTVLINRVQGELKKMEDAPPADIVPNVSRFEGLISEKAFGGLVLPNPIQQTVPAWALFGMFFIVVPLSNSMLRDRKLGIFRRLLSFPVSRGHLLIGKVLPFLVINFLQFCLMFLVGVFVLPRLTHIPQSVDFSVFDLALVTLVCSMAATGYGLMIACLAKTQEQVSAFGSLSVVVMAVVGGVMIPRFVMPDFMQIGAMVSPMYWGLEAYQDIILRKAGLGVAGFKLAVLLGFSFVCGAIAMIRFRWNEV